MSKEKPIDVPQRLDEITSRLDEIDGEINSLKRQYETVHQDFSVHLRHQQWKESRFFPPPDYLTLIRKEIELALENKLSEKPVDAPDPDQ